MNTPHDFQTSSSTLLERIVQAASELEARNIRLEVENEMLRHELEQARQEALYLRGRLEQAERAAGQHVENNFYNDRTTLIRESGLTGTNIHMQVMKKNDGLTQ